MNQSKTLTEGALFAAIYTVFLLIAVYIPVISVIAMFLLPVPFILFTSRHGLQPAVLVFLVTVLLSIIFASVLIIPLTLFMGLGGIMIGSAMYQKRVAYETWARGTVGFVIGMVLLLFMTQLFSDINIIEEVNSMIDQSMERTEGIMDQFGIDEPSGDQLAYIEEQIELMKNLIPAVIAIAGIIFAFVSQWIGYKTANRVWNQEYRFPPFRNLTLPLSLVWIYFIAIIFSFFDLDHDGTVYLAVQNVMMLTRLLMALQGFSFIFYFAYQKNMSKALPVISIIATLLVPILFLLVSILGVIDLGFRLRSRISDDRE